MPLIGTAGHVDHGKSTLIQRLTGRDPDRWAEEKRRGLTIDLGFAWTRLPNGIDVSFVDVPGHERYLKNMLAGIEAIDVALFVVAADEGWMPQSEEHLAVLDLLQVTRGVVALTKIDTVDSDLTELAQIETAEKLEGSSLESASIIPVSGVTGEGADHLIQELESLVTESHPRDVDRPRLWVDRSFSATGSGTVVTGTLLDGSLSVGDEVQILPGADRAKIRAIQSHESSLETVGPGRRVALNLTGIDRETVGRGQMVSRPGQSSATSRFLVGLRNARYLTELDRRGAYQLHIGSSVHQMSFVGLDENVGVIVIDDALPTATGDRFVIRDTGRQLVVAGGRVLDIDPGPTTAALATGDFLSRATEPDSFASALLSIRGRAILEDLEQETLGGYPSDGVQFGQIILTTTEVNRLRELALAAVQRAHEKNPLRPGLPLATLAESLSLDVALTEMLIENDDRLVRTGPDVAVTEWEIELDEKLVRDWETARQRLVKSLAVPPIGDLDLDEEVIHLKIRTGALTRISGDLVMLPEQVESIISSLRSLGSEFTVAEARDETGLSRKYVVPFLEWSDKEGLTVRRGDTRRVR